jgi:hypothetical protein
MKTRPAAALETQTFLELVARGTQKLRVTLGAATLTQYDGVYLMHRFLRRAIDRLGLKSMRFHAGFRLNRVRGGRYCLRVAVADVGG